MSQTLDEMINSLAEKVGQEANDKAKAEFKAIAYAKIQQILTQPITTIQLNETPQAATPAITATTHQSSSSVAQQDKQKIIPSNDKLAEFLEKKTKQPPQKPKRFFDKTRILIVTAVIALALVALVIGGALGQTATGTSLSATPDNSNIIQVYGTGFNTSAPVSLQLLRDNDTMYNFNADITTNANGSFSCLYIIPTSLSGAYSLTATAGNTTARHDIIVPDLRGAEGLKGVDGLNFNATGNIILNNGTQGAEGPKGDQGVMGNSTVGIVAIGLSIAALVIVIIPRKQYQSAP